MARAGRLAPVLRVRAVTPPSETGALVAELVADPAVVNIVLASGAARKPDGDLVTFDVAREAANDVIGRLRARDLHRVGSITVERIDVSISDAAARAEALSPGDPSDAVIWEEVEARVRSESGWSLSFTVLLVISGLLAAIGVLVDSPILIVGAMAVGPEYGPISLVAYGLATGRAHRVHKGLAALAVGLPITVAACGLLTVALRAADRVPAAYLRGERPLTSFISSPDLFAVLVAVLAGIAGAVTLAEARHGALVGVLVSVTTIPAAANIGVALVMGRPGEAGGALAQLALNLALLMVVGALTFRLQAWVLRRPRHSEGPSGGPAGQDVAQ